MSRLYGDPIEVWTREGQPVQFVWRDRLHTVRRILDHWVVSRELWKISESDPGERRFWRLEAGPGGGSAPTSSASTPPPRAGC
ncbi:DUF6504 family protein [Streptosporangium lutulentum]